MSPSADLLFLHASVFTADPSYPQAEAVAVSGHLIVFVGNIADAEAWRGPATRVIDAHGATLLPGFIDSHFHLLGGSLGLDDAQLFGVGNAADLTERLAAYAAENPDRDWLVGQGLNYGIMPGQLNPSRHDLDRIVSEKPLILYSYDFHTVWANSRALEAAGLLHGGVPTGPNSEILMADDGTAHGELRESGAYGPALALIPPPDDHQKRSLLHKGLRQAAEEGITSVHNMDGNAEQLGLYAALEDLGELTLRVYVPYSVKPETSADALHEAVMMRELATGEMVRSGAAKFFMDGVIEGYTGLLVDDYAGMPGNVGSANYSAEHFNRMAIECDRLGLQIFVHAVGDGAVRRVLDGYEAARDANGPRDSRHRVEHIELVHPDDVPRFAELGVIASMQPLHSPMSVDSADVWPHHVGPERWEHSFAWQALRDAGARVAFGSDWNVVSQSVMQGLHAAVNRTPWREGDPDQKQTLTAALISYTHDAAFAEFQEHRKGQIRVGTLADLVLLSDNLFEVPPTDINGVRPIMTVCNGRVVFEA